jgi:hypothetical protein
VRHAGADGRDVTAITRVVTRASTRAKETEISSLVAPAFLLLALGGYWLVYHLQLPGWPPVRADGEGYYAYLPAYFVYHDDSFWGVVRNHFIPHAQYGLFSPTKGGFGLSLQPTGKWLDKYEVGEAILLIPFFLVGHGIGLAQGLPADGYSNPELYAVGTAAAVYATLGLAALRSVLRRTFSDGVTAATLVVVAFGSSLFHYSSYDSTFSHAFSFGAMALTLVCGVRWYERPSSIWRAAALGIAGGAVVVVRVTDAVMMLAVLLWGVGSLETLRARLDLLKRHLSQLLLVLACGALMVAPQIITWWIATRQLIVQPYVGETFDFARPQLLPALVALFPHGLLPYAPALGLCFVGLAFAWVRRRDIAVPVTIAFIPFWYLMSSWWDWSFSDGFGDRIYINILPLLALPLAVFFASLRFRWLKWSVGLVTGGLVIVTVVLMVAFWRGKLPGAGVSQFSQYVQVLLHP